MVTLYQLFCVLEMGFESGSESIAFTATLLQCHVHYGAPKIAHIQMKHNFPLDYFSYNVYTIQIPCTSLP